MTTVKEEKDQVPSCPVCGHSAWPIMYGMVPPNVYEAHPETVFAGCVITEELWTDPVTGVADHGVPEWECQSDRCRHRWW
ncbi:hypothetical protein MN0502_07480 [Arthrobacter sp. MN05-02]|nr:hypothetical protein MN0502_07480 [Arthrobacter sp. MN05-02]